MARIRSIHPGLFTDEAYMALSFPARELIKGLWCEADDNGVFEWKPLTLKARIMPADNIDMPALLAELVENRFVVEYEAEGKRYGAIRNFRKYQRPKKPSEVHPLPNEFRTYVGLSAVSSEPVGNQFGTGGEKSPQMEDGGGRSRGKKCREVTPPTTVEAAAPEHGGGAGSSEASKRTEIAKRLCGIIGVEWDDPRWFGHAGCISQWIANGWDPELDIYPAAEATIRQRRQSEPSFVPNGFRWFEKAIARAYRDRTEPATGSPNTDRGGPTDHGRESAEQPIWATALLDAEKRDRGAADELAGLLRAKDFDGATKRAERYFAERAA